MTIAHPRPAAAAALLLLLAGCGRTADPPAPLSPAPTPGLALAWTSSACTDPGVDQDDDGVDDRCELALAQAFAPLFVTRSGGCNWDASVSPARPGGEYLFAVQEIGRSGALRIAYLPAYYRDCGRSEASCLLPMVECAPHRGDSEAIILDVAHEPSAGRWRTERVFLSAHCFGRAGGDCRWFEGTELGALEWVDGLPYEAPVVWVAEGKNANYPTKVACDRGHFSVDTCDRNDVRVRFPVVSSRQNIGSRTRPAGGEGGCLDSDHVGWESDLVAEGRRECFWSPDARFLGWQRPDGERGATPYFRYLVDVARF